jgi:hypothetical protein
LEFAIAWYRGKILPRFNDTFGSLTAGIVSRLPRYENKNFLKIFFVFFPIHKDSFFDHLSYQHMYGYIKIGTFSHD